MKWGQGNTVEYYAAVRSSALDVHLAMLMDLQNILNGGTRNKMRSRAQYVDVLCNVTRNFYSFPSIYYVF